MDITIRAKSGSVITFYFKDGNTTTIADDQVSLGLKCLGANKSHSRQINLFISISLF